MKKVQRFMRVNISWQRAALIAGFSLFAILSLLRAEIWLVLNLDPGFGAGITSYVDGTAPRPFVQRILVPQIAGIVVDLTPQDLRESWGFSMRQWQAWLETLRGTGISYENIRMPRMNDYFYMRCVALITSALFLVGYAAGLFALSRRLFPSSLLYALIAPSVGLCLIQLRMTEGGGGNIRLYDSATLCLMAWSLYAMLRSAWMWVCVLFVLTCLNKETGVLLVFLFVLLHYDTLPKRSLTVFSFQLMGLWLLIYFFINERFSANPGVPLEWHMMQNMHVLLQSFPITRVMSGFALLFLILFAWNDKPEALRRASLLFIPLYVAGLFFFMPREYRAFYEFFPVFTLLLTHTLLYGTGIVNAPLFRRLKNNQ